MRSRAAIEPDASTTKITRLPSRPSRIALRMSSGPGRNGPSPARSAADNRVANRCSPCAPELVSPASAAVTTLPEALRARDRRPGAPSPTPGTVNARVRNTFDGGALGFVEDDLDGAC